MKKKIVIADADERFCSELVAALQDSAELEVVGTATDGEQAILLVKHHRPDILVLDTLLPKYDGLTVLERLRKTYFCPKALIVSAFISNYVAATAVRKDLSDRDDFITNLLPQVIQKVLVIVMNKTYNATNI